MCASSASLFGAKFDLANRKAAEQRLHQRWPLERSDDAGAAKLLDEAKAVQAIGIDAVEVGVEQDATIAARVFVDERKRRAANRRRVAPEPSGDTAHERRFASAELAAQEQDVAVSQRAGDGDAEGDRRSGIRQFDFDALARSLPGPCAHWKRTASITTVRRPRGVCTATSSPTTFPIKALAIGEA